MNSTIETDQGGVDLDEAFTPENMPPLTDSKPDSDTLSVSLRPASSDDDFRFGIEFELPDPEYRAAKGIAQSALKEMRLSPAHFRVAAEPSGGGGEEEAEAEEEAEEDKPRSAALDFGTALHTALLEPSAFNALYVVAPPDFSARTKAGKLWKADMEAQGRKILKQKDLNVVDEMILNIMAHPIARLAVQESRHEAAIFAPIEFDGVVLQRKGKTDMLCNSGTTIADLKSTTYGKGHPDAWGKVIAERFYHVQAAYYLDMVNAVIGSEQFTDFVHIVVEKTQPHAVACYRLSPDVIEEGRTLYMKWLRQVAECTRAEHWPAYPATLLPVELPKWATKKPFDILDL